VAERVLPNGLRVVAVRRPSVPVVHVRLRVPTAVRRDEDLARSAMLERGMLLGTAERSQGELAEALGAAVAAERFDPEGEAKRDFERGRFALSSERLQKTGLVGCRPQW